MKRICRTTLAVACARRRIATTAVCGLVLGGILALPMTMNMDFDSALSGESPLVKIDKAHAAGYHKAPGKVKGVKVKKAGSKKVKVAWKKVRGAKGYKVKYSYTNSSGKKVTKTKTVKGKSVVLKNLANGKNVKVSVKAYKMYKGKRYWGKASSSKSRKVGTYVPAKYKKIWHDPVTKVVHHKATTKTVHHDAVVVYRDAYVFDDGYIVWYHDIDGNLNMEEANKEIERYGEENMAKYMKTWDEKWLKGTGGYLAYDLPYTVKDAYDETVSVPAYDETVVVKKGYWEEKVIEGADPVIVKKSWTENKLVRKACWK